MVDDLEELVNLVGNIACLDDGDLDLHMAIATLRAMGCLECEHPCEHLTKDIKCDNYKRCYYGNRYYEWFQERYKEEIARLIKNG